MAQNTMNINSKDVVKSVESKNVESTSNEQRQTNKPIVISRRRLLRAGVAGIPVVLTMAGVAPAADGIQTVPSAASAMWYGGNKVYNRFYNDRRSDGLVWTDHNGFVLLPEGGVKTQALSIDSETDGEHQYTQNIQSYSQQGLENNPPAIEVFATIGSVSNLSANAYAHKTGYWYTDLKVGNEAKDLADYIKTLPLTIKATITYDGGNTEEVTLTETQHSLVTDVQNPEITANKWYSNDHVVMGYTLVDNSDTPEEYYLLDQNEPYIYVTYKATVSCSLTVPYTDGGNNYSITATCNQSPVNIPLKLKVDNIPSPTNDDHSI